MNDEWNDAGTKPDHPCLCETVIDVADLNSYQYWNGEFWCFASGSKDQAIEEKAYPETSFNVMQWREVQS